MDKQTQDKAPSNHLYDKAIESLKHKFIVGVTGGIGCGKTTVTDLFATHGIEVVDADVISREVVAVNSPGLKALVNDFGSAILSSDNTLNRSKLRELIFADPSAKQRVNNILHPLIRDAMFAQLVNTRSLYCILSAPLLFENKLHQFVNLSLVVDITPSQQLERTLNRDGGNASTINNIIASQISRNERLALAGDIIDNSKTQDLLAPQVVKMHKKYTLLANQLHPQR